MSKTAEEWTNQGDKHDDNNELEQAIECFDKAIALNPNYGRAYFLKSFVNEKQGVKTETLVELCRKALSLGYTTASCYENLGNYLMLLNQLEEAVQHLKKSFEIDNGRTNAISYAGKLLECLGRKTEAMACYDLCLTHHPGIFKPNYFKGNLLAEDGKFQESLQYYAIATGLSPLSAGCAYRYATALNAVGRKEEATQWYTRGSQTSVEASIDYCLRGQCHRILGHKESAMKDFKSAQEIVNAEKKEMLAPDFVNFIRATLKSVFEAEDAFAEVEAAVNNLDPNNSIAKKFTTSIKKLQEQKEKAQAKALSNIDKAPVAENRHAMSELELLKEEFRKQLAEVQGEVKKIKSDVTKIEERVTKVEGAVEDLKQEINNKMDDFFKKLENELKKQDLSSEDIGKLKGYFKAFVETFSSIHVTSQVVDSGQVQLDSDSSVASVLSFAASFAPFIGNALATGVKSLGDFLKSKEMKTNARKLKRLAPDATQLSQIIGKSGYEILINKKKQEQILQVTTKESQNMTKSVFEKLVKLCDKMSESVDVYLYTDLYPTPSEKVGHSDANILIAKWIEGSILPGNIEEQFVEEILNPKLKEQLAAEQKIENGPVATRSGCCNLF